MVAAESNRAEGGGGGLGIIFLCPVTNDHIMLYLFAYPRIESIKKEIFRMGGTQVRAAV